MTEERDELPLREREDTAKRISSVTTGDDLAHDQQLL